MRKLDNAECCQGSNQLKSWGVDWQAAYSECDLAWYRSIHAYYAQ